MSFFSPPPKPVKPSPPPRPGERGERGVRYGPSEDGGRDTGKRRQRGIARLDKPNGVLRGPDGRIVGDGESIQSCRWYYDEDGNYVRVRGKRWIVERFGPRRALAALTEPERAAVMNARQNARRRDKAEGRL